MTHTPGPWKVYGPVDMDYWVIHLYPNSYYQRVATAHWNHPENTSAVLSNAALIAAAPEMLAVLEKLSSLLVDGEEYVPLELREELTTAIRKARVRNETQSENMELLLGG